MDPDASMVTAILLLILVGVASAVVAVVKAHKQQKVRRHPPSFICAECASATYADATSGFGLRLVIAAVSSGAAWVIFGVWAGMLLTVAILSAAVVGNDMAVSSAGRVCEHCHSRRVVPLTSPIGEELARDHAVASVG